MKISDFRGEQALDLFADLIEPAAEIMADKNVVDAARRGDKLTAIKIAVKAHKKAVIRILAILDGEDPETYSVSILTLPVKLLEILNDEETINLFRSQGQMKPSASSGSATENTEEVES